MKSLCIFLAKFRLILCDLGVGKVYENFVGEVAEWFKALLC